jgi:tRNA (guanine-N7-)-methyltransferase
MVRRMREVAAGIQRRDPGEPRRRGVVSYVRRGERMTTGQQRAWDTSWAALGRELGNGSPHGEPGVLDLATWFDREAPLVLEIGSGMGESTAALAAAAPHVNYLAVEVYKPGLAQLLMRADALGLANLRLLRADAVVLLRSYLAPGSLSAVRVFFPDPWPKKRHHKRRLVNPGFVALAASRLCLGGSLHLATDCTDYAERMKACCAAEPALANPYARQPGGWAPRPPWRPVTKFEQRARQEGREVHDLIFRRV